MNVQTEIEVHPLAKVYRLYIAEEMEDLIASIKKNGLRDPIMLDEQGRLIDGRNRLKACREAGVEPRFETFKGNEEAIADYIYDKNSVRRDLTIGQKAIAFALLYPEGENKGGRGKTNRTESGTVSRNRIFEARTILKYARADIDDLILGVTKFDAAYQKAAQRKREDEPDKRKDERLAVIAAADPALAGLVQKEQLTIEAAEKEMQMRLEIRRARERKTTQTIYDVLAALHGFDDDADSRAWAETFDSEVNLEFWPSTGLATYSIEELERSILALESLRDIVRERQG